MMTASCAGTSPPVCTGKSTPETFLRALVSSVTSCSTFVAFEGAIQMRQVVCPSAKKGVWACSVRPSQQQGQ